MAKTYSGGQAVSVFEKCREAFFLGRMIWRTRQIPPSFSWIDEYERHLRAHTGLPLRQSRALELGFGARPLRLNALLGLGVDVRGVDRDRPVARRQLRHLPSVARENGTARAAKTAARLLIDRRDHEAATVAEVARRGGHYREDPTRLIISDFANPDLPNLTGTDHDLVYSEDVFEHIPRQSLDLTLQNARAALRPGGIALIRPNVFNGITGGHLVEWYPHAVTDDPASKRSEPWEHLRKQRFRANTYLNEVSRREFRDLFGKHFDVLAEVAEAPDLGRDLMTPELRTELDAYDDDELFSNRVLWVLRRD